MLMKSSVARFLAGNTVFLQFSPGTSFDSVKSEAYALKDSHAIRSIPDKSVEESISIEGRKENLKNKMTLIKTTSEINHQSDFVKFTPIKISALVCPNSLEKFSNAWNAISLDSSDHRVVEAQMKEQYPQLMKSFEEGVQNIQKLCEVAKSVKMSILIDAEESTRQPAIDFVGREVSRRVNMLGESPTVYHTYQMYLLRSPDVVRRDMAAAESEGYVFAAKLVRGAYRISEGKREIESGVKILQSSKEDTDKVYDQAVTEILERIATSTTASSGFSSGAAVMIATHNTDSVVSAVKTMERLGISPDHGGVHVAQLKGMADHLTVALGDSGYNAHKLFAYGEFKDVMPFLIRRMNENQDAFGALQFDRALINQELKRRFIDVMEGISILPKHKSATDIKIA
eukprot:CAMPEP_0182421946 /NCGR_PEP_ID=MMETSP1167-20130531/7522_1 /TAXON_ID=2988 /ORGANISM="Mallomonas Sp, Strain CCMP3275" /LENGTH=399 /DNA_ID=CAMNT_0024599595 /DNA_START=165 /DNA_END=1364 /DNA_ORIENTATION=-